jgi:hypothetical protein
MNIPNASTNAGKAASELADGRSKEHATNSKHSRMSLTLGHIALNMTFTHSPPIQACTPYQMLHKRGFHKVYVYACHHRESETDRQSVSMRSLLAQHTSSKPKKKEKLGNPYGGRKRSKMNRNSPSHRSSIKCTPQAPINPKTRSCNNREGDMENCTRASVHTDEWSDEAVPNPHTQPSLPP